MTKPTDTADACVFVTGAGSGIGNAVSNELERRGHQVFGGVLNQTEAEALVSIGKITPIVVDVTKECSVREASDEIDKHLDGRPLRGLLNIAGVISNEPLIDLTHAGFEATLRVNLIGVHNVTRAILPHLKKASGSRIINMSSQSGVRTMPFTGAYSASKFGLEALTTAMRYEFAPFGIDVAVFAPGLVRTPMADKIQKDLARPSTDDVYREPLKRFQKRASQTTANGILVEDVAAKICDVYESKKLKRRYETHQNFLRDKLLFQVLPKSVSEATVRKLLGLN